MSKKVGLMEIGFSKGVMIADAKTGMVDLKSIEKLGMKMSGITEVRGWGKRLEQWITSKDTKEFIEVLERKSSSTKISAGEIYKVSGRGRHSKAWGNLHLALKYAMYLNKELEVEVIDTFINSKILDTRLLGIDYYKELNVWIDTLEDRIGKDNRGVYIQISREIRKVLEIEESKGYDDKEHNAKVQAKRKKLLEDLTMLIKMGFIKTYPDLKKSVRKFI